MKNNQQFYYSASIIISLILATLLLLPIINYKYWNLNISNQAKNEFVGDRKLIGNPITSLEFWGSAVTKNNPIVLNIPFRDSVNLSGFSIFFPGNLHATSSFSPKKFEVYYQKTNEQWILADKRTNYSSSTYQLNLPENLNINAFRIILKQANFNNTVVIKDLKFYKKTQLSFTQNIHNFFQRHNKDVFSYFSYSLIMYLLLIIPGYVIFNYFTIKYKFKLKNQYAIIFAPAISIVVLAITGILFILTRANFSLYLYPLIFILTIFLFIKKKLYKNFNQALIPILLVFTVLFIVNSLQAQRDFLFNLNYLEKYLDQLNYIPEGGYYGYHADNTLQWGIARAYLNKVSIFSPEADALRGYDGNSVFARTPFLPIITIPILKLFGESHFIYQRFLNLLMAFYYGAVFLLIKSFFSKKTALITSLLVLISGQLTYQAFNTEIYYKYVAIYPVLLALVILYDQQFYVIKFKHKHIIAGIFLSLGYFLHPIALFFIGSIFLVYFTKTFINPNKQKIVRFIQKSIYSFLPVAILFISWMIFAKYYKTSFSEGTIVNQNLYVKQVLTFTPEALLNKFYNIINIFLPDFLGKRGDYTNILSITYLRNEFLRFSIISAITPIVLISGVIFTLKNQSWKKYWQPILLGLGPYLFFLILFHTYAFGVYTLYYPFSIPLFLGLFIHQILKSKYKRLILISFPLYMLAPLYFFSGVFPTLKYKNPIITIIFYSLLLSYLFLSSLLFKLSSQNAKN